MQDKANSRPAAAVKLGVSLRTFDRIVRKGDGPRPVRVSERRVVFFDSEIERYKQRKLACVAGSNSP
jgi:predicted DNA-binding transcriptional regulator AlpA